VVKAVRYAVMFILVWGGSVEVMKNKRQFREMLLEA